MSKRANKKNDPVEEKRRELRCTLERLFQMAADWAWEAFGQRIRRGAVLEAIGKYKRRRIVPDWMSRWLTHRPMVHA